LRFQRNVNVVAAAAILSRPRTLRTPTLVGYDGGMTKCSVCLKQFAEELRLRAGAFGKYEPVCPPCWKRRVRWYLALLAGFVLFNLIFWLLAQNGFEWWRAWSKG
jgi:hypothetical protein